jgi:hypothetical protein
MARFYSGNRSLRILFSRCSKFPWQLFPRFSPVRRSPYRLTLFHQVSFLNLLSKPQLPSEAAVITLLTSLFQSLKLRMTNAIPPGKSMTHVLRAILPRGACDTLRPFVERRPLLTRLGQRFHSSTRITRLHRLAARICSLQGRDGVSGKRVLTADDHPILRGIIRSRFECQGFEVSEASHFTSPPDEVNPNNLSGGRLSCFGPCSPRDNRLARGV